MSDPGLLRSLWNGLDIIFDDKIPVRDIRLHWTPPEGDPFVEYEESDHGWMERLGMGSYTQEDRGPLVYQINEKSPYFRAFCATAFTMPRSVISMFI